MGETLENGDTAEHISEEQLAEADKAKQEANQAFKGKKRAAVSTDILPVSLSS